MSTKIPCSIAGVHTRLLLTLARKMEEIKVELASHKQLLRSLVSNSRTVTPLDIPESLHLPITSMEAIDEVERKLSEDSGVADNLVFFHYPYLIFHFIFFWHNSQYFDCGVFSFWGSLLMGVRESKVAPLESPHTPYEILMPLSTNFCDSPQFDRPFVGYSGPGW